MDYKKIIKSREIRIKIMHLLDFVPDKIMLYIQYYLKTKNVLHLKNPQRYTEKLQWYKLFYRNKLMKQCVDKYDVRQYIKDIGLDHILSECYGVYDAVEDLRLEQLPEEFVLKDTLGGGGNSVLIVPDKNKFDWNTNYKKMNSWVHYSYEKKQPGREWVYDGKPHRIIVEELLKADKNKGGLIDYKFFCFNGNFKYLYVVADRELGRKAGLGIYDRNFNKLNYSRIDENKLERYIEKPEKYETMIEYAERISKPFPHARVDLYNINGVIRFGEITFFDGSGYMTFDPDEFDYILGKEFIIDCKDEVR